MEAQSLASALAALLDQSRGELAAQIKKEVGVAASPEALGLIDQWLEDQIRFLRRGSGHASEWLALVVDQSQRTGGGFSEVFSIVQAIRNNFYLFAIGKVPGASDADILKVIFDAEDQMARIVIRMYDEAHRKMAAAEMRRRKTIAESARHPFVTVDNEGAVTLVNSAFTQLLGVSEDYLVGRNFLSLCDNQTGAELRRELRQRRKMGARILDGAIRAQAGNRSVRIQILPFHDEEGLREGLGLVFLTPSLDAVGSASQAKTIEQLADGLRLACYFVDRSGRIIGANAAASSYVRVGQEEQGVCCCRVVPEEITQCDTCLRQDSFDGRLPFRKSLQIQSESGENRWVELACFPLRDAEGHITQIAKVLRDVTEQKIVEDQLLHEQRSNETTQLAVAVAHQLRNPLGIMIGLAEMLSRGLPPDQITVVIEKILASGFRCKKVVEDLLDLDKITREESECVNINELIQEKVVPSYTKIKVLSMLAPGLGLVKCIPDQLNLVLVHLIDFQAQGAQQEVIIETSGDPAGVTIKISRDTPLDETEKKLLCGPEPAQLGGQNRQFMMITLARRIIEGLGGRLLVRIADPNAVFLQLPAATEPTPAGIAQTARPETTGRPNRRILIVEDEPDQSFLLALALQGMGHEVDSVTSAGEGIHFISRGQYDAIVIDILLGETLGGRDIYQFIQRYDPDLVARTIFITGDTLQYETRRFLQEIQRPALEKPFLIADLVAELDQIFEKHRADGTNA